MFQSFFFFFLRCVLCHFPNLLTFFSSSRPPLRRKTIEPSPSRMGGCATGNDLRVATENRPRSSSICRTPTRQAEGGGRRRRRRRTTYSRSAMCATYQL
ncbi:uncharacterized protein BO95DRAFT_272421 [Aspergillus brunneoviolaceus CBS 621.78]|uniref:Uncharacterized protein n=1 Tax=Aspergillus brunneoviolaceus CBS 621.78 TaxID=1450534 RepID=A0ACD1FWR4_9EURO|nr:hypothetical protein BO95DRAFT_272421 [Aspergillus brunneoviolaceus CBS 621.78]RAH41387.1 hypothetical protein BO95DRAFT_272421 [Aspergillus brunneoviolaceus CBS 621.78]